MDYASAIDELVAEFPNLKDLVGYDEAIGLPHAMFGTVFCPWVEELLKSSARSPLDDVELGEAFRFIERMLEAGDEDLENVVVVTVLNFLVGYCGRDVVARWCGPLSATWLDRPSP